MTVDYFEHRVCVTLEQHFVELTRSFCNVSQVNQISFFSRREAQLKKVWWPVNRPEVARKSRQSKRPRGKAFFSGEIPSTAIIEAGYAVVSQLLGPLPPKNAQNLFQKPKLCAKIRHTRSLGGSYQTEDEFQKPTDSPFKLRAR
jgi:hypothetical protein